MRHSIRLAALVIVLAARAETPKPAPEPRVTTIHPLAGEKGSSYRAVIRGAELAGARSVMFTDAAIHATVVRVEADPPAVHVEVNVGSQAAVGASRLRVVTPLGVSNEGTLSVVDEPAIDEEQAASPLAKLPAIINGRLVKPGEVDAYWFDVEAGQVLTFEAISEHGPFDPSLTLYEPSGSWFSRDRLNRIAFADEPLYFPGLSTDARLVHRFSKSGRFCLKVGAFSGQGGPDFAYQLRIVRGESPAPPSQESLMRPAVEPPWDERRFTRVFDPDWLMRLARRGMVEATKPAETYRAATDPPVVATPALMEGTISGPAEVHAARLKVDKAQDLVIEIETPAATMPRFNPVVRVLEPGGSEIVTNVYTKLNNNGLYMMKMIQAKTAFSLNAPGEYKLEIRDITTDCSGNDFSYRVLVRQKIPHIGKVEAVEDRVNVQPGMSKPVTIRVDREEDYTGFVVVSAEGLPAGVTAVTGIENPVEKPPLPNGGKLERYTPKTQTTVLMLVASPDAAVMETPAFVRIVAWPVMNGQLGEPIPVKEIPVMVVARRAS